MVAGAAVSDATVDLTHAELELLGCIHNLKAQRMRTDDPVELHDLQVEIYRLSQQVAEMRFRRRYRTPDDSNTS